MCNDVFKDVFSAPARMLLRRLLLAAMLSLIASLLAATPGTADTLTVGSPAYPTIGSAVAAAQDGDTVLVPDGTYSGPGNVDVDFGGKAITVESVNGPATTIINCGGDLNDPHGAFLFQSGEGPFSVVQGFTIENANQINNFNAYGAVFVYGSDPFISQCVFANNTGVIGGAVCIWDANPTLSQCTFTGNSAVTDNDYSNGGAIEIIGDQFSVSPVVQDCAFAGNSADGDGGAIDLQGYGSYVASVGLVNCSFYGNDASGLGSTVDADDEPGTIDFDGGTAAISNCIFYGDTSALEISTLDPPVPGSLTTQTCDIDQALYAGTPGNIDADPEYVNPAAGNLQIQAGSPCNGTGTAAGAPAVDINGNPWGSGVAIGAYAGPVVVPAAPAATQLVVSAPATASAGSPATFTVTAEDQNGSIVPGYSGTVAFSSTDSQAALPAAAILTNGTGSFQATFGTVGSQTLTATDTANSLTGTSAAISVGAGPASRFVVTAPSAASAGAATTFTITARDASGNVAAGYSGTVGCSSTDSRAVLPGVSTLTSGVGSFTVTFWTGGAQTITAADTTASGLSGTSSSVTVAQAATTMGLASSLNPATAGQSITFTATVGASVGATPTGTVTFTIDGVAGTPVALVSGAAAFSTSSLAAGSHSVSAAYSGDATFLGSSTATALTQTVTQPVVTQPVVPNTAPAATVTALSSSSPSSLQGQRITLTVTVHAASGSGIPAGTVSISNGTTLVGTATLNGAGTATLTTTSLPAGSDSLTAAYSGNANFAASTSAAFTQVVHGALHVFSPGLQMIAVPENYANVSLADVWSAPGSQPLDTWAGGPAYLTGNALPAPGRGAWVNLAASATVYDTGAATPTTTPFAIPLQEGWNLIGNPFPSAVAESSLAVQTTQSTSTFAGGETAVYLTLYTYSAGASAYAIQGLSGSLAPYQGYWMYAYQPCTLLVPAPAAAPSARL